MKEEVEKVLEMVRPSLQADGGDIKLVGVDEKKGIVKVRLQGHCVGCPMSQTMTLRSIEQFMKEKIPAVKKLELVL